MFYFCCSCRPTTAAADTSSEVVKKIKDRFLKEASKVIVKLLDAYRRPGATKGFIQNVEDFKHLAKKVNQMKEKHFVFKPTIYALNASRSCCICLPQRIVLGKKFLGKTAKRFFVGGPRCYLFWNNEKSIACVSFLSYTKFTCSIWTLPCVVCHNFNINISTSYIKELNKEYLCFIWSTLRRWDISAAIQELFSFLWDRN